MGFSCFKPPIPPEVQEILDTVAEKAPEIVNNFVIEANKIKKELEEILNERKEKVEETIKKESDKLEEKLLEYNLKEIENEKELIMNEVEKMHSLYELGLSLSDKLKNITIDQLNKKLNTAPSLAKAAINAQIEEIKKYSTKEFLGSKFGEPLRTALEKQGLREENLQDYMKELEKERKERRKKEREDYKEIKKNEFPPKDDLLFDYKDLYKLIFEEYKSAFKDELRSHVKDLVKKGIK